MSDLIERLRDRSGFVERGPMALMQHCEEAADELARLTTKVANDGEKLVYLDRENTRLTIENDTLRGLLGNSAKPCQYCGLAAEDQARCAHGFPGCSRADDQMLSKHFAAAYDTEECRKENAALRALLEGKT